MCVCVPMTKQTHWKDTSSERKTIEFNKIVMNFKLKLKKKKNEKKRIERTSSNQTRRRKVIVSNLKSELGTKFCR